LKSICQTQQLEFAMHILITSAAAPLARSLASALCDEHTVRRTERITVPDAPDLAVSNLGHDLSTNLLVRGMDAIVHVAEPLPADSEGQQIDYLTRCTYNLCWAAASEGVRRLIFLSTLDLLAQYDERDAVSERWRPRPTPEPPVLSKHLGEFVCREFAREHKLDVTVLRLGRVVYKGETATQSPGASWVDERDVAQAVRCALARDTGRWTICHVQHESPGARFSIATARRVLGFAPQHPPATTGDR
jgi:nucleoside-diphosphate-sugar epimerase